jgi:hypothetical protein
MYNFINKNKTKKIKIKKIKRKAIQLPYSEYTAK